MKNEGEVGKASQGALPNNAGGNDTVPISVLRGGGVLSTVFCGWLQLVVSSLRKSGRCDLEWGLSSFLSVLIVLISINQSAELLKVVDELSRNFESDGPCTKKQGVALSERNRTALPCNVGRRTGHALGPVAADRPRQLQTTTDDRRHRRRSTDDSVQKVIILMTKTTMMMTWRVLAQLVGRWTSDLEVGRSISGRSTVRQ